MAKVRVKINGAGIERLQELPAVDDWILGKGQRVAAAAGPGFRAEKAPGRGRARTIVFPDDAESWEVSATTPAVLIGALNAAR